MKPTQITELLTSIRATFVSFFSILMFVALGVGVFLGISWAGPALENAADAMMDEGRFHDFQVQFLYGLTDDDLAQLAEIDGVSEVEAGHQSFQTLERDGADYVVKVQSLGRNINVPIVREGTLPARQGEIALHVASAKTLGLGVGDVITFEHDANESAALAAENDAASPEGQANANGMTYLNCDTFKVTAIIDTAEYLAKSPLTYGVSNASSGAVNLLSWVPDDTFNAAAYQNGYPIVNVTCESLRGNSAFSESYEKASSEIEKRITEVGTMLATKRYEDLHGQAQAQVNDAEAQLSEGKQKISEGEQQLAEGRNELETRKAEGEQRLDQGYQQLLDYEDQRADGEAQLEDARAKVAEGTEALAAIDAMKADLEEIVDDADDFLIKQLTLLDTGKISQEQYNARLDAYAATVVTRLQPYAERASQKVPEIDHTNFEALTGVANLIIENFEDVEIPYDGQEITVAEARQRLAEGRALLEAGEAEYAKRVAELEAGWAEYYAGQDELDNRVAEGEQQLVDGERELTDAKEQVAENEPKVEAAKAQVEAMKERSWAVLPRAFNAGVVQTTTFNNVTGNLSFSMAALFIIVGLLVSYFAVARIVHEEVVQIGTKKALGFREREITGTFLLYSGIAVVVGAIVGALAAVFVVETIIGGALGKMFAFGTYPPYFSWGLFGAMALLELVLILGSTYLACRGILKRHAVELLRGEKPPAGKTRFYEKWGLWERLPLFVQTIVNNCVNDKRRMLSTIVGVAGSTALIVTAITLNNDVMKSYDLHYADVYGFNAIAYVKSDPTEASDEVEKALRDQGASTAQVVSKGFLLKKPDGGSDAITVVSPVNVEDFEKIYHVRSTEGAKVDLSAEGAWVTEAYANHMDAKVGDLISVSDSEGVTHQVPILGFYEFWLTYHEMVVGPDYYQKEFGESHANALLTQTNGKSVSDLRSAASQVAGFDSIVDDAKNRHKDFETFSSVSGAVVAIYLALAALMAVVVLLNLNFMFIEEKKRELIVLMINGFSVKDAKHYIAYDSVVLTVLGTILGIVLGCIMGSVTVAAIEPSTATFVKGVDSWAVAIGIVGSLVLAGIMGFIALRRIPKFKLTDINKM